MSETSTLIGYQGRTISRQELALIPTPAATATHVPVLHHEIVQALVETLGFRHIRVAADEHVLTNWEDPSPRPGFPRGNPRGA